MAAHQGLWWAGHGPPTTAQDSDNALYAGLSRSEFTLVSLGSHWKQGYFPHLGQGAAAASIVHAESAASWLSRLDALRPCSSGQNAGWGQRRRMVGPPLEACTCAASFSLHCGGAPACWQGLPWMKP
jgi:hypothetical protein